MPKEKEGFREELDRLSARFPGRETISITEACEVVGISRWTLMKDKDFPAKKPGRGKNAKIVVPIVALARYLS